MFGDVCFCFLLLLLSESDDFSADSRDYFANRIDWTPEKGFYPELPVADSYLHFFPRPGVGSLDNFKLFIKKMKR